MIEDDGGELGMKPSAIGICMVLLSQVCLSAHGQAAQPDTKTVAVPPAFKEMQAVEDRWSDAVTKRDQYGMELVLAPQFIGISASGEVTTRNQQISLLFAKNSGIESLEQKVISVRFVGDVAIVNGTYKLSWKMDKNSFIEKGIFSHVFEHVRNTWLCLNSQRTVVAEDAKSEVQQKAKTVKHSDAALPMHIPMIYKGPTSTQPASPAGNNTPP